ncbi:MAG: hypothetical protein Q8R57_03470 [Bacteroidota bacterium]|nr:hypothetical protein [Bacteroidota bacterium]
MLSSKSILLFLVPLCFLIFSCKNEDTETITIKGKLLKSCENPSPLVGHALVLTYSYNVNGKEDVIQSVTNSNGSFEFKYEKKVVMSNLALREDQTIGYGYFTYLNNIETKKNLDIGTLYNNDFLLVKIRINAQRVTSIEDTIYYDFKSNKFNKFIVGPFIENQLLDTIFGRTTMEYNKLNKHKFDIPYSWKLGLSGKVQYVYSDSLFPCSKENYLDIKL